MAGGSNGHRFANTELRSDTKGRTMRLLPRSHAGQGQQGGSTHARLQNLRTRTFWEHSFRADLKLEEVPLEKHSLEFLYGRRRPVLLHASRDLRTDRNRRIDGRTAGRPAGTGDARHNRIRGSRSGNAEFPEVLEVKIADTAPPVHQQADTNFKPAKVAHGVEVAGPAIRQDRRHHPAGHPNPALHGPRQSPHF